MPSVRQKKLAKTLARKGLAGGSFREVSGGKSCLDWRLYLERVVKAGPGRTTAKKKQTQNKNSRSPAWC